MRVLLSAYACEPGEGSEPGVGWNLACGLAAEHAVWVLTRSNNREVIEAALETMSLPNLRFVYVDLPSWARWWKRGSRGVRLYYYLWQIAAALAGRRLARSVHFDLVHHVTFVRYWSPSFLAWMDVPLVWGPVGGGESLPPGFLRELPARAVGYEVARTIARKLGELDPFVRATARKARLAFATTPETAVRMASLGAARVEVLSQLVLADSEFEDLSRREWARSGPARFVSVGRLIHWKGFALGLEAFACLESREATYVFVGEGPERRHLETQAAALGVSERVTFTGRLSRKDALEVLRDATCLVHPSLHDSGGWVCLEAMALGKPVICLDWGGPGVQVTEETGMKVSVGSRADIVAGIGRAMAALSKDTGLCERLGTAGRALVAAEYVWSVRARRWSNIYSEVVAVLEAG